MPLANSDRMKEILDGVHALTARVKQDRGVSVNIRNILRASHVVGCGFLPGADQESSKEPEDEDLSMEESEDMDDADYKDEDDVYEDDDDLSGDDDHDGDGDTENDLLEWVNSLAPYITKLHSPMKPGFPTPCPNLAIEPRSYQYRAMGMIERVAQDASKALLIADPPGLGKTLPCMMATVKAIASARRFSVVVVPSSCVGQWGEEFKRFFNPGAVRVLILQDPSITATTMTSYDVVITSYAFVMSRYRKMRDFTGKIAFTKKHGEGMAPERPNLSILSELFTLDGIKCPYLILDEVNAVKNPKSLTFAAISELRRRCITCVMLTGRPIDNSWPDVFSFLQFVEGQKIRTRADMLRLLATRDDNRPGRWKAPSGRRFLYFIQILNSFMVRRPESTVSLPPLTENIFEFSLSENEAAVSNQCFETYQKTAAIAMQKRDEERGPPFKSLMHALQHACHPKLVDLMEFIRFTDDRRKKNGSTDDDDILYDAESIERWTAWRDMLRIDDNWQSSRIIALIDAFNQQRDLDPSCSVLIFDESVYFLDIVQIAFASMYDPVDCLRYDGREPPEKREIILDKFKQANGDKVLLMSRGTGGVGLNIPWANVVIQCGPWWKKEWEIQGMKRAWRPGQERRVTYITLSAKNCNAERYKAKTRDRKHKFNMKVVNAITRGDDEAPRVWEDLE